VGRVLIFTLLKSANLYRVVFIEGYAGTWVME